MSPQLLLRYSTFLLLLSIHCQAEGTVPTFQHPVGTSSYTLVGKDPSLGGTTTIPTLLVPVNLRFSSFKTASGSEKVLAAAPYSSAILQSPVFSSFRFGDPEATQYADAVMRATFVSAPGWHILLGAPTVKPITVDVPVGYGYVLSSKRTGTFLAVADVQFVQRAIFRQLPKEDGKLVVAVVLNTTFYSEGDATVCCSSGTHGVDDSSGHSFVLASFFHGAPDIVEEKDVQPLTEQLAEFMLDPLHNPLAADNRTGPGNHFPAWLRPPTMRPGDGGRCGGTNVASRYFLLEPTDTNPKNNLPASQPYLVTTAGRTFHVQNVALLPWYTGPAEGLRRRYSFPDARVLPDAAEACPAPLRKGNEEAENRQAMPPSPRHAAIARTGTASRHQLIGYWEGYRQQGSVLPLRDLSKQWDVIIVAFAVPNKNAKEGTMRFEPPGGMTKEQLKADIAFLKQEGRTVLISLGGGGQHFTLADPRSVPNYVSSVTRIVEDYGFDGIDIDFESPSLSIDPGDDDFRHPKTPSILNLIAALRQLHDHFGPKFAISLVPEGTQIPAGLPSYGGQFGSYLAITNAIRDILTFIDVQDYNTPPLEGLDGEIYQAGSVDYHAAMTELLLHGFPVAGRSDRFFPPLPPNKVAVGFLTGDAQPMTVLNSMLYLITGSASQPTRYRLRNPHGYPDLLGAMFWTIDADQRREFNFSNLLGPALHELPRSSLTR